MTFSLSGQDFVDIIEIASIVGTVVSILVFGLIAYFMVRPKRRRDAPQHLASEQIDMAQMLALMDRMERRLATLERAIGGDEPQRIERRSDDDGILEAAEGRELGRTK